MIFLWGEQTTECETAKGRKMLSILIETIKGIVDQSMDGFVGKIWTGNPWVFTKYAELSCSFSLKPLGKPQSSNQKVVSRMK